MSIAKHTPAKAAELLRRRNQPKPPGDDFECEKCRRTGLIPISFVRHETVVESNVACDCAMGLFVAARDGIPVYTELPAGVIEDCATARDFLTARRKRTEQLREQLKKGER